MNILEAMEKFRDDVLSGLEHGYKPSPPIILMSHKEWEAFSAACREAGITEPSSGNYWNWRLTGKVVERA